MKQKNIRVEVDDKQIIDVEMQVDDRKDLKQRGPLYMCKNISTQIDKGNDYTILKPSIAIWILNFNCFKVNSYHSVARMMFDKEKSKYVDMGYKEEEKTATDMLEMHFIEMPKFLKKNPGVEDKLDQWLWLISGKGEKIEMAEKKNKNIEEALERVDEVMQDPEVMELYFNMAVSKWDYNSGMQYGKEEGRKEGKIEGRIEGRLEGEKTKAIEIAKDMKKDGVAIDKIEKYTGLTKEEIEKL